ncbi:MAG: phosphotransferase enzyme family protein [Phycisphaerales bacterium]
MQPSSDSSFEPNDHFHARAPGAGGGADPSAGSSIDAQREKFHAREIAQVLSHYDLGVITQIREYRRGSRRAPKVKLDTERGEFMLKRKHAGHSRARAEAGHALQARAAQGGVPVAELVAMRHGGTLLELGDRLYEMYRWVPGTRFERDPEQAREAGVALARLHRALWSVEVGGDLPTGGFSDTDAVRRSLYLADASARLRADAEGRTAIGGFTASLDGHLARVEKKLVEKGLPLQRVSACHGDFHPGNTLWFGVTLGAVIDFDSARHESVAAELANAMLQFALKHRVGENPDAWQIGLDTDRLRAFCAGYASQPATVPHAELAPLLPWLMMSAVIAEAAAPIARDGDFAGIPAVPFLRATSRLVDWISDRTRAISSVLVT